jgi:hypothetical protein
MKSDVLNSTETAMDLVREVNKSDIQIKMFKVTEGYLVTLTSSRDTSFQEAYFPSKFASNRFIDKCLKQLSKGFRNE